MTLHRKSALDYAKKYWSRVCDDERIGTVGDLSKPIADFRRAMRAPTSDGWEAIFVRDAREEKGIFRRSFRGKVEDLPTPFIKQHDLEDCTHYVSRCLMKEGVHFTPTSRANELATAMVTHPKTKTLALRTTRAQGQQIINTGVFKAGDLIAYSKAQQTPFSHTAMFVGKNASDPTDPGGITCHSVCRYRGEEGSADDEWFLHDGLFYTLVHFSDDDPRPSHATRRWLPGWWRVRHEYYFMTEEGHAFSTSSPPVSKSQRLTHGSSVGYYFDHGREVVFIWRRHSLHVQVERWTASADPTRATVVTNGLPLTVSRVHF
jgi:hypothetical protein